MLVVKHAHLTFFYDIITVAGVALPYHDISGFAVDHIKRIREDAFMRFI